MVDKSSKTWADKKEEEVKLKFWVFVRKEFALHESGDKLLEPCFHCSGKASL